MKKLTIISIIILSCYFRLFSQITEYSKFLADDGTVHDQFGYSVAVSGNYAVVGAHQNNTQGEESGCAYIFEYNAGTWLQSAILVPSDGHLDDEFGYAVSISGEYAVVGAYMDDDNGNESGSAYIFRNNGTTWEEAAKLTANDGAEEDYFGYAVSISGNYAIIGAYGDDDNGLISGSVYIYYNNEGNWEETKLSVTGNDQSDKLGTTVHINGDYAVAGAMNDDDNGANSGAVYIFHNNEGIWGQTDKIVSNNCSENDYFGSSVAVSDEYIAVGAFHEPHPNLIGKAYVFENNAGTGIQTAELVADDGADGDFFGNAVSIWGDTIIVGAHQRDDNGTTSGAAYAFTDNGSSWDQIFKLLASDGEADDNLGCSVNISGNCVILGAYGDDDNGDASGSAYVYYLTEDPFILDGPYDAYVNVDEIAEFKISAGNVNEYQWQVNEGSGFMNITNGDVYANSTSSELKIISASLGMNGYEYRCIVSNSYSDVTSSPATLHVSNSTNPSVITETQKLLASDGQNADHFGYSVDVSGDYIIVGAHQTYSNLNEGGYAYIFKKNGSDWQEIKKLEPSDAAENDDFGLDVAIDGDYAVVGSYRDDDNGENSGSVYIFGKNEGGTDNWGFVTKFSAGDGEEYDYFGYAVAVSGNYAMAGAYGDDDVHNSSGAVYVYYNNSGTWEYSEKLKTNSPLTDDRFGWSIDMYGDNAIIGANNDAAYIFHNNSGTWEQVQEITADDANPETHEYFGISVGIAEEYAVIGAYHDPWPNCNGSAYVFFNNEGAWEQDAKLSANDGAIGDIFGNSVAVWADTLIVGAPRNDFKGTAAGCAYVFTKNSGNWEQQAKMVASDGETDDRFGFSVAIDANTVVVGARADDDNGATSGSAYVFDNLENPFITINDIEINYLDLYPNPTSDFITININEGNFRLSSLKIFDIQGRCVLSNNYYNLNSRISVKDLPQGIYILRITSEGNLYTKKFIKK